MFRGIQAANKLHRMCIGVSKSVGIRPQLALSANFSSIGHSATSPVPRFNNNPLLRSFSTVGKTGSSQTMEFQAETRKLLDIVTNSIYTDKEVFIRELVSNASDALEKYRYKQVNGEVSADGNDAPLEINIVTDAKRGTLTISDNGIGMSRDELIANLGTIARSGSKQFVESLKTGNGVDAAETANSTNKSATEGIIGQFGVGFYSSFMVSDSVEVESISALNNGGEMDTTVASKWSSDGSGMFDIDSVPVDSVVDALGGQTRGSRITMHLKDSCKEYADAEKIKA
jgi:HSP90 family molecular chaperone